MSLWAINRETQSEGKHSPWKAVTILQTRGDTAGVSVVAGETGGSEIYVEVKIDRTQ